MYSFAAFMVLSIRCKEAFGSGMFRSVQISLINPLAITSSSNRLAISSLRSMRNLAYVVRHVAINRQYTKMPAQGGLNLHTALQVDNDRGYREKPSTKFRHPL